MTSLHRRHWLGIAGRVLAPLAVGHLGCIALMAGTVVFGLALDRLLVRGVAGGLLLAAVAVYLLCRRAAPGACRRAGRVRLAGWAGLVALALASFLLASAQGVGLALVPALAPLCAGTVSG